MVKFSAPEDRVVHGPGKVTDRVTDRVTEKVTDAESVVLKALKDDPGYSYGDLAELLSISRKTIAARIKSLKEKQVIERVGTAKKGYWKITE